MCIADDARTIDEAGGPPGSPLAIVEEDEWDDGDDEDAGGEVPEADKGTLAGLTQELSGAGNVLAQKATRARLFPSPTRGCSPDA